MSYQNYSSNREYKHRKKKKEKHGFFQFLKQLILKKLPPINKNLLVIVFILIVFGTVAIFSATAPDGISRYDNPLHYPARHIGFAIIAFIGMFITSRIHYKNWENWVKPITYIVIALIFLTLVPGIGKVDYGSARWIGIGPLQIQPSEFCKFTCILLMASTLDKIKSISNWAVTKTPIILILIMFFIIFKQPNMSMLIILTSTIFAMLFVAGLNKMIFVSGAGLAAMGAFYFISNTAYQSTRITGWLHPWDDPQGAGYNIIQSWYAISSGGLLGVGLGASKQKLYYLPVGYTDFIFSVIAEEMGFVGVIMLIALFLLFIAVGFKIAARCDNYFGKLLAFGIVFNIGFQAITNMCVASGVFPVTGVTLPLISYGGSSFIATCGMLGVLFNISRYAVKKERKSDNEQIKQQPQT